MSENPLLSKLKLPGRIFQLPSKGLLYTNSELSPSIKDAELHIKPMSAFDEINMKNADLLYSGKALDYVFSSCVDGIEKPTELFGKDIDALMLYLRLVTYGPLYEIVANHYCKDDSESHIYTVNIENLLQTTKFLNPSEINSIYTITFDNGQIAVTQPPRYSHIIEFLQANQDKKKLSVEDEKNNLMMNILNTIKSVDGIEDRELLKEWIYNAPSTYITKIIEAIDKTNDWGIDLDIDIKCKDCGEIYQVSLPINPISFFS